MKREDMVVIPTLSKLLQNRGNSSFFSFNYKQSIQEAVVVYFPKTNWSLIVAQSQDSFFAPIKSQQKDTILFGLLSIFLVTSAGVALGYFLELPISNLMKTVESFSSGDLNARSSINSKDQLGKLAASFNSMAEQISNLLNNLENRSQELELSQSMTVAITELATAIFERERLLKDATYLMLEQFKLEVVRVYLWNEQQKCLILQQETSASTFVQSINCAVNIPQWVVEAINDLKPHDSDHLSIYATAIPMIFNNKLIGVLELQYSQKLYLSNIERDTFKTLANQIAIAWSNAQLISYIQKAEERSRQQAQALEKTVQELQETQGQLIQTEKMSSLGQLVAGIAHEINNPVSFIHGNLIHLEEYSQSLLNVCQAYEEHYPEPPETIIDILETEDIDFIKEDFPQMMNSMQLGTNRIRDIIKSLRNFSRLDEADYKKIDIHEGIDSTLLILQHRLKANGNNPEIKIVKQYQSLPKVDCFPSQLNQVFMNILNNAIDALEENESKNQIPTITISTKFLQKKKQVKVIIEDNGSGIPDDIKDSIFDPFFTTKPIGKGTGLGMSISYKIITEKHDGKIKCQSEVGKGTSFTILLPTHQN